MAGIIKADSPAAARIDPQHAAFNFDDLAGRARAYLDRVREQAAQILRDAEAEAGQIRAAAQQEGLAAARQQAEQEIDARIAARLETALPAVGEAAGRLAADRDAWRRQWEQNAIELAAAIAGRIVRGELTRRPELPLAWIREALELASGAAQIRIQLHPDDREALGGHAGRLASELAPLASVEIVGHDEVPRGGCRLVTEFGTIDQRLDEQLARIREELW